MLGTALGDAMGGEVEFRNVTSKHPLVASPFDVVSGGVASFTDDTQMTYAVALGLLDGDDEEPHEQQAINVARRLIEWQAQPLGGSHRAPGNACMMGVRNLKSLEEQDRLRDWRIAGKPAGKGCGVAMRSAPYGWLLDPDDATRVAATHALMTHRSPTAQASGAAVADALASIVNTHFDLDPFTIVEDMALAASGYDWRTAALIWEAMYKASVRPTDDYEAVDWDCMVFDKFRGWVGDEAVAAAVYAFLAHPESFEKCMFLAVNTPGDSDSIAAIAGAISGAYTRAVPEEWASVVECRHELLEVVDRCVDFLAKGLRFNDSEPHAET
jgi:ADP-ribosylglycohydrolase